MAGDQMIPGHFLWMCMARKTILQSRCSNYSQSLSFPVTEKRQGKNSYKIKEKVLKMWHNRGIQGLEKNAQKKGLFP